MKALLFGLGLILSASASHAFLGFGRAGNEGGHGGGGVCDSKGCQTLAQAGLRLKLDNVSEFELEPEVVDEITRIINILPLNITTQDREFVIDSVIGDRGTLRLSRDQDSRSFKKYRKEYLKLLESSGSKINKDTFQLLAASDSETTYIFHGYFRLNTRGKALLMIHEYNIRRNQPLNLVLVFDGMMQDLLQRIDSKSVTGFDYWSFTNVALELGYSFESGFKENDHIIHLIEKAGGKIKLEGFCELKLSESSYSSDGTCFISRAQALRLRTYHPAFAQAYSDRYLEVGVFKAYLEYVAQNEFQRKSFERIVDICAKDSTAENYLYAGDIDGDGHSGLYVIVCGRH